MRIVLVRHPAPLIEPGICYGRLDMPLHPDADIDGMARDPVLHGSKQVWTSPSRRCRETADRIAETLRVPLTADPRLLELDFGAWEGKRWDDVPRAELDRWAANLLGFNAPGGESGSELIVRVESFYADLRQHGQDCAVVSHGGPLRVLAALLRRQSVDLLSRVQAIGVMVEIIL